MSAKKTLYTKIRLAKKIKQNRQIPIWKRQKKETKIPFNIKKRHWRKTKIRI